ncbi:MAG: polymer-forming cytoskeletal protein [Bacteroidota bacterium]
MLPARALFYALLIALLIAMLTAALVALTYFYQAELEDNLREEQQIRNLRSGLALLLEDEARSVAEQNRDLHGQNNDWLRLAKYPWGLFSVAWAETRPNPLAPQRPALRKIALVGESTNRSLLPALYLADRRSPLALSGFTTIRGDVLLPQAGIKRGYVDGQGYLGDQLVYGSIQNSNSQIPELPIDALRQELNRLQFPRGTPSIPSPHYQSFRDSTLYLRGPSLNLGQLDLSGRIVIQATDSIYVGRETRLEDVILVAPTILIEAGFEGSLQALATRKLVVGEAAFLRYPSVLGLIRSEAALPNNINFLDIQSNAEIRGLVFVYSEVYSRTPERLVIQEGAIVKGQVVVGGNLELRGTVLGNVTCSQFVLRTPSSVYSNHLHNAVIDRPGLEPYYCGPFFYNRGAFPQKVAKWLE